MNSKMKDYQPVWWKEGVIYQIYPRSFFDSNGDGIGDLGGIYQKLDYLNALGVDILWVSPFYQSPMDDNGYDVSDFRNIQPEFGTMDEFDRLLESVHARGMRLVMDLVPNHTSDEHRWFQASKKSIDNPYRDYYIWRKPFQGGPPSNWQSFFSGSAWEWDEQTGEYYLHLFSKKQADLNWENPKMRQEMYDIMKFWLDKGIDGFRMDVVPLISKRLGFPPMDVNDFQTAIVEIYANGPRVHEYLREMHQEVLQHYDVLSLAEGCGVPHDQANDYVGKDRKELDLLYHFEHLFMGIGPKGRYDPVPFDLMDFKQAYDLWYDSLGEDGWAVVCLGNHDFPRMLSRFGEDLEHREMAAKLLITLLATQRGTLCIYQGDELGMTNVAFPHIEDYDDVEAKNYWRAEAEGKPEEVQEKVLQRIQRCGRDNARTPMQWSDAPHAGFTQGKPWLQVNPNYVEINAAQQEKDETSVLAFYTLILALRKRYPVWVYGAYENVLPDHPSLYVYRRWNNEQEIIVALNFSITEQSFDLPAPFEKVLVSNADIQIEGISITLGAWQAAILI